MEWRKWKVAGLGHHSFEAKRDTRSKVISMEQDRNQKIVWYSIHRQNEATLKTFSYPLSISNCLKFRIGNHSRLDQKNIMLTPLLSMHPPFIYYETRCIKNVYLLMYFVMVLLAKLQLQSHDKVASHYRSVKLALRQFTFL